MQGKGAGPVNRVELESQVLCAALRQSCHIKDKIGAFTSVRELSHLFPDLLPPSEKDDEASSVNKDNFYLLLRVKPQTAANGVLSAYLRAIRRFLRSKKVVEHRTDFNRILNAGFILRKPRLRLSHDLVVARRWLHEESRMAQVQQQEITTDSIPAYRPAAASAAASVPPNAPPALAKPGAADGSPTPPPLPAAAESGPSRASAKASPNAPQFPAPPLPAAAQSGPSPAAAKAPPNAPQFPAPPLPAAASNSPPPPPPPLPAAAGNSLPAPPLPAPSGKPAPPPLPAAAPAAAADIPPLPVPEIAPPPLPESAHGSPSPPPLPEIVAAEDDGFTTAPTAIPVPASVPAASLSTPEPGSLPQAAAVAASLALAEHGEAGAAAGEGEAAGSGIGGGAAPPAVSGSSPKSLRAESFRPVGRDTLPLPPGERVSGQAPLNEFSGSEIETLPSPPAPPAPPAIEQAPAPAPVNPDEFEYVPAPAPPAEQPSMQPHSAAAAPQPELPVAASMEMPVVQPPARDLTGAPLSYSNVQPDAGAPGSGDLMDFPPAAVRAQSAAAAPPEPPRDRPPGRISKEATFVFDESQLRKPLSTGSDPLPIVVQLLEAAQVIGPLEVQALKAQMAFAPNIPVEKHILNAGYVTAAELASAKLGESLLQSGKISMAQFQVAFYDERYSGLRMAESLQVRGWLSVEVRNAIDEWQKKSH